MREPYHTPVLLKQTLSFLLTNPCGTYADATCGGGGHARAILKLMQGLGKLYCADRDNAALQKTGTVIKSSLESDTATLIHTNFGDIRYALTAAAGAPNDGTPMLDGLLLDLGVSSRQIDDPARGFSYRYDGPLDMRMDQMGCGTSALTAEQIVNEWDEREIARVLWEYGEERHSRSIARAIVAARPLQTTLELAAVVEAARPRPDFVTKRLARVFQAFRVEVNREMEELDAVLDASTTLIKPGGRLVVLSYHSLEDRRVKRFMRSGSSRSAKAPRSDVYGNSLTPWETLTRKPIVATEEEIAHNPRARSAKLRVGLRTGVVCT